MREPLLAVVVYDVASDRRRDRLRKLLREYGVPVQESAFEMRLTPAERAALLRQAAGIVDPAEDSVIVYGVPHDQEERIAVLGRPRTPVEAPRYYLV